MDRITARKAAKSTIMLRKHQSLGNLLGTEKVSAVLRLRTIQPRGVCETILVLTYQ